MNKDFLFMLLFPLFFITQTGISHSVDTYGSFADDGTQRDYLAEENELLSVEVSKSNLKLLILGTVTNGKTTKALIKNPVTGELGKYVEGDRLDLVKSENVKILEIANCMILIERSGTHETLECNNKMTTVVSKSASLSKYQINRPASGMNISTGFNSA